MTKIGDKVQKTTKLNWTRTNGTKGVEIRTQIAVITSINGLYAEYAGERVVSVVDPLDAENVDLTPSNGGFRLGLEKQIGVEYL